MMVLKRVAAAVPASVAVVLLTAPIALAAPGGGAGGGGGGAGGSVPNVHVDPTGLPGAPQAAKIIGGLMFYALLACLAGLAISAARHQIAVHQRRPEVAAHSLHGMQVAGTGALITGAAHALVAFFFGIGVGVH
jgi:hypothetical protein